MPLRTAPPTIATKAATEKILAKQQEQETLGIFIRLVLGLEAVHLVAGLAAGGIHGYIASWAALLALIKDFPPVAVALGAAFVALYVGLEMWRNPKLGTIVLPPFPPVDDLRFNNDIYVGSGWTRNGKQPGDEFNEETDELLGENPHVILKEKGLFGNLHVKGGVGGGKTATLIMPFLYQAINKYPRAPSLEDFTLGPDGRYPNPGTPKSGRLRKKEPETSSSPSSGPVPEARWEPYSGMTGDEAAREFERISEEHQRHKWGLFVIDPKGDMTEKIQRMAILAGRGDDVFILKPDGEYTYNALNISSNPLVQSEMVMDGIEAVSGMAIQQFWRQVQSEWLSNALTVLAAVDPASKNFKGILKFARSQALRQAMLVEAKAIMERAQKDEEKCRILGQPYYGVRINPAAIDFFEQWDDEDTDVKQKQAVVSGIQAQAKFFVEQELAAFLCPEMPATFPGFDEMIDKGYIVILQMPLGTWSAVAKVLGILVLADAQQSARDRINKTHINQERVIGYVVDEIASYLNKLTKEFISINRQSRVSFLASHQSQGQLALADRSFETSFNDNLRTKISYSAPHAESAKKESALFGSREVFKESWSQGENFSDVQTTGEESFAPGGTQSKSASMRVDEIEKPWFQQQEFMSLLMGELVISEFDGVTTLPPRKVRAVPYFTIKASEMADALVLDKQRHAPHPVVSVHDPEEFPESRDYELVERALEITGFVIIEMVSALNGKVSGVRLTTDCGTLLVPLAVAERLRTTLVRHLGDSQKLVILGDVRQCGAYLCGFLGVEFDRVLELGKLYALFGGDGTLGLDAAVQSIGGRERLIPASGAWEWLTDKANFRRVVEDSRRMIRAFVELGKQMDQMSEDDMEKSMEAIHQVVRAEAMAAVGTWDPEYEHASPAAEPLSANAGEFAIAAALETGDSDLATDVAEAVEVVGREEKEEEALIDDMDAIPSILLPGLRREDDIDDDGEPVVLPETKPIDPLPRMLRRKDVPKADDDTPDETQNTTPHDTTNAENGQPGKRAKGARKKGPAKPGGQDGSAESGPGNSPGRRKKNKGHTDLGLDADGPAAKADDDSRTASPGGGSNIVSGAPIN